MPNCSSPGADALAWLIDQAAAHDFPDPSEFAPFLRVWIARGRTSGLAGGLASGGGEPSAPERCRY